MHFLKWEIIPSIYSILKSWGEMDCVHNWLCCNQCACTSLCSVEVFRRYRNDDPVFKCAKDHPGNIVEAACLAVSRPACMYVYVLWTAL